MFNGAEVQRTNRLNLTSSGRVQSVGSSFGSADHHVGSTTPIRRQEGFATRNRSGSFAFRAGPDGPDDGLGRSRRTGGRSRDEEVWNGHRRSLTPVDDIRNETSTSEWGRNTGFGKGCGGGGGGGGMDFFMRRDTPDREMNGVQMPVWMSREGVGNDTRRGNGDDDRDTRDIRGRRATGGNDEYGAELDRNLDTVLQPTIRYKAIAPPGTSQDVERKTLKFARDNFKPPSHTFVSELDSPAGGCPLCMYMAMGHGEYVNVIPMIEKDLSRRVSDEYTYSFIAQFWNQYIKGSIIEGFTIAEEKTRTKKKPIGIDIGANVETRGRRSEAEEGEEDEDEESESEEEDSDAMGLGNEIQTGGGKSSGTGQSDCSSSEVDFLAGSLSSSSPSSTSSRQEGRKRKRMTQNVESDSSRQSGSGSGSQNGSESESELEMDSGIDFDMGSPRKKRFVERRVKMSGVTSSSVEHHFTSCIGAKNPRRVLQDQIKKLNTIQKVIYDNGLFCMRVEDEESNNDGSGNGSHGQNTRSERAAGRDSEVIKESSAERELVEEALKVMQDSVQIEVVGHEGLEHELNSLNARYEKDKTEMDDETNSVLCDDIERLKDRVEASRITLREKIEKYKSLKTRFNLLDKCNKNGVDAVGRSTEEQRESGIREDRRGGRSKDGEIGISVKLREAGIVHTLGRTIVQYQKELQKVMEPAASQPMAISSAKYYSNLPMGDSKKISWNDRMVMQERVRQFSSEKGLQNSTGTMSALSCYYMAQTAERQQSSVQGGGGYVVGGTSAKTLQITQQSRGKKKNITAPKYTA